MNRISHDNMPCDDPIVEKVVAQLRARSRVGVAKYGTTLDRDDLTPEDWRQHHLEELMDAVLYVTAQQEQEQRQREQAP